MEGVRERGEACVRATALVTTSVQALRCIVWSQTPMLPTEDTNSPRKSPPDATALISMKSLGSDGQQEVTTYGLYRGMIERLSPAFFNSVVDVATAETKAEGETSELATRRRYIIREELQLSEEEFTILASYLLHDMFVLLLKSHIEQRQRQHVELAETSTRRHSRHF